MTQAVAVVPALTVDPEFHALIPPLSQDEYAQLEASLLTDGCRDPLILWRGSDTLVDGHNRYEICRRHDIPFALTYRDFDCREAVIVWMIENQLGRRNLPEPARIEYALKLKPAIGALNEARRNASLRQGKDIPVVSNLTQRGKTREQVAAKAGVSNGTFHYAETILTKAPAYVADLYRQQSISAYHGYELYKALKAAPERARLLCERTQETNLEKIAIVVRLARDHADTLQEIEDTGFIQPGDEHQAVGWLTCSAVEAQHALDIKRKFHARDAAQAREQAARSALAALGQNTELPDTIQLIQGDFRQLGATLESGSIDAIITDPPYPREFLPLYGLLGEQAARLLKPGGLLLAMCGQSYLPDVLALLTPHLRYHWTVAYLTPGGQSAQIWPRKVNTFWKPVVVFTNGDYAGDWIGDVVKSAVNDNDKRFHEWGQSASGMIDLMARFVKAGDTILDPFMGGGTTGVVAAAMGCRFIGIDLDVTNIELARGRIIECPTL